MRSSLLFSYINKCCQLNEIKPSVYRQIIKYKSFLQISKAKSKSPAQKLLIKKICKYVKQKRIRSAMTMIYLVFIHEVCYSRWLMKIPPLIRNVNFLPNPLQRVFFFRSINIQHSFYNSILLQSDILSKEKCILKKRVRKKTVFRHFNFRAIRSV